MLKKKTSIVRQKNTLNSLYVGHPLLAVEPTFNKVCGHSETVLEKTKLSFAGDHQSETASGLGMGMVSTSPLSAGPQLA